MDIAASVDDICIADYIDENRIGFLNQKSRDVVLQELCDHLRGQDLLNDVDRFYEAIIQREEIVSTGIGMGVAIPHAKMKDLDDFFIVVGLSPNHGIDWEALDHLPVHIVFMIGGPADQQSRYLAILSALTKLIRNEDFRMRVLRCSEPQEVIDLIQRQETSPVENPS